MQDERPQLLKNAMKADPDGVVDLILALESAVARLTATVEAQGKRIEELEARLKMNSRNSSKHPSKNQYSYMKTGDGFEQCCSAQAGAEVGSMLVTGAYVSARANDKLELLPNIEASAHPALTPDKALSDTGYCSEDAITKGRQAGVGI